MERRRDTSDLIDIGLCSAMDMAGWEEALKMKRATKEIELKAADNNMQLLRQACQTPLLPTERVISPF